MPLRYDAVLSSVASTVWAIEPTKGRAILELLRIRAAGGRVPAAEIRRAKAQPKTRNGPTLASCGTIAVLPVFGVIAPRMSLMTEMSGGISAEQLGATLTTLANDPSVSAIVLDVDSPGGAATGIPELAAKIRAAAAKKRVVAVTNHLAASAAYWLASQATELVCTPSGEVGSIGVYMVHFDESGAYADAGIKPTIVRAGKFKAEGNPFEALGADASNEMQRTVDDWHSRFVRDVATGRGTSPDNVRAAFGRGRSVSSSNALRAGMVDRIATIDEVVSDLRNRSAIDRERQRARAITAMCRIAGESDDVAELLIMSGKGEGECELELFMRRSARSA